jgi:hypothetical protein
LIFLPILRPGSFPPRKWRFTVSGSTSRYSSWRDPLPTLYAYAGLVPWQANAVVVFVDRLYSAQSNPTSRHQHIDAPPQSMSIESFRISVGRHGIVPSVRRSLLGRARRVVDFELCRVECNSGDPYTWPDVVGYDTRIVGEAEFHQCLCEELRDVDYRWAFKRGDICSASFHRAELVGYSFYSSLPTRVRDGVTFTFPPQHFVYAYASATAPSHRGRRLEQDRWKVARRQRNEVTGRDPRILWYVNVANLESRATSKAVRMSNVLLGYIAWVEIAGGCRFFSSSGCRRAGTLFVASDSLASS